MELTRALGGRVEIGKLGICGRQPWRVVSLGDDGSGICIRQFNKLDDEVAGQDAGRCEPGAQPLGGISRLHRVGQKAAADPLFACVERAMKAASEMMEYCVEVGGTLSGEHGIGLEKKEYMPLVFNEIDLSQMKKARDAFAPNNLLNPGKIFDISDDFISLH